MAGTSISISLFVQPKVVYASSDVGLAYPTAGYTRSISLLVYTVAVHPRFISLLAYATTVYIHHWHLDLYHC